MKRIAFCLLLTTLTGTGCFTFGPGQNDARSQKPPQTDLVAPSAPVKPGDVKAQNIRDVLRSLETEIARDEVTEE